jgi:hypothetical protein
MHAQITKNKWCPLRHVMAEANHLLSALDKAHDQLAILLSCSTVIDHFKFSAGLSSISSPIASALAVEAGKVSQLAGAASLLASNVVFKLASFLGITLEALGECKLFEAADGLQGTWELALVFLHDLVADGCSKALWQPWLAQLSDAGTNTHGMRYTGLKV